MSTRSTTVREPLSASSARFEARARAARWRARRPALIAAAAGVVVVALAALAWFSPVLDVRTIEVTGVSGAEAAAVQDSASAVVGTPLPRVGLDGVRDAVQHLPYVASARVERSWPRTLSVQVTRRVPVAAVPVAGGGYRLVDAGGVAYAAVRTPPRGVPAVTVPLTGAGHDALTAALTVLEALPPALRGEVSQVSADTPDDVRMRWGAALVVWGSADDVQLKSRVLADLVRHRAHVYDVSSPHTPVLR